MKKSILFILLVICSFSISAQDKKLQVNGYISNMQSFVFEDIDSVWNNENLIHNRININYYANNHLTLNMEIRNRLFTGDNVRFFPNYSSMFEDDKGLVDLTGNIIDKNSFFLNSTIDRAKIDLTFDKLNITIGRQRINWGQTFVWNPNDIFNSYSYFDFDYEEKPGSDAIRAQYYIGSISSVELVAKSDSSEEVSIAGLYRFNKFNYDFQILAGKMNKDEFVAGLGWSGFVKSLGFRGEISQIISQNDSLDNAFLASLAFDYYFANSAALQFEALFIDNPVELNNFQDYYTSALSIRNLSFTKLSFFASGSYPITPILNISLAGMFYPKLNGFFVGPSLTYTFSDNTDFSFFFQSFSGEFNNSRETFNLAFLRLKYSF
jgi:hypothetical protein